MSSAIIISDFLKDLAVEAEAPERSIIEPWGEAADLQFSERVVVIDTKVTEGPPSPRETPVVGESTYETMSFFRESLHNLLESGRVVIALLDWPLSVYATESRTVGFSNYSWLPRGIGTVQMDDLSDDEQDHFIRTTPDSLDSWPVRLREQERPFNPYFTNVEGSWVWFDPSNSSVQDYEEIAYTPLEHIEEDTVAMAVESWENEAGDLIEPEGTLVLLPRPDRFWFDIDDWFRSLLEIGYYYSSSSEDFDQFNRLLGRTTSEPLKEVYQILHKFPNCASSLQERRGDKEPVEIDNEYDVQYLLEPFLRTQFDDVRPEEYSPSHGGTAPRIDFLIKQETIAVEAKITRSGRGNDDIRSELADDKELYRKHPDCEYLVCYVYDPGREIDNPAGFEADVSEDTENLTTEVLVSSTSRFTVG